MWTKWWKCSAHYIVTLLGLTTTIWDRLDRIPNRISETPPVQSFWGRLGAYDEKALFFVFIRTIKDFSTNSSGVYPGNSRWKWDSVLSNGPRENKRVWPNLASTSTSRKAEFQYRKKKHYANCVYWHGFFEKFKLYYAIKIVFKVIRNWYSIVGTQHWSEGKSSETFVVISATNNL